MEETTDLEQLCKNIEFQTDEFFKAIRPQIKNYFGYKILYGPPYYRPPIIFIGYQPGGGSKDYQNDIDTMNHKHWPTACLYATESWPLAKKLQTMLGEKLLSECVGLNAIFLRAPDVKIYKSSLDKDLEIEIGNFCKCHVLNIIDKLQPQKIVLIGLKTAAIFGDFNSDLKRTSLKNHNLTMTGSIGNHKALAVAHLTGTRLSRSELDQIKRRIREF